MATPNKPTSSPGRVGKRELRAFLDTCSREDMLQQVVTLFTEFEPVREYYQGRLRGEDDEVRDRYKALIRREFAWTSVRPPSMSLVRAKRAIADYRKVAASVEGIADLLFYYVETALLPLEEIGFEDEGMLVMRLLGVYRDAIVHVRKHGLDREFVDRSYEIAQRGIALGYGAEFQEIHDLAYGLPHHP